MHAHAMQKNPYYVDVHSRFIIATPEETPVLYTTAMTFCVVIGFIYKEEDKVKKFALYHSYSEHIDCEDDYVKKALSQPETKLFQQLLHGKPDNLILAIKHFLSYVKNIAGVKIVVGVNSEYSEITTDTTDPENAISYHFVKRLINRVCRNLNLPNIEQFEYYKGNADFFLLNDGSYLSSSIYRNTPENQRLAKYIANFVLAQPQLPKTMLNINDENHPAIVKCEMMHNEILKARNLSSWFALFQWGNSVQRLLKLNQYLCMLQAVCDEKEIHNQPKNINLR